MFLLPKGNPLYENLVAAKVKIPEMLDKLKVSGFSGYAAFNFRSSSAILLFEAGKLISVLLERDNVKNSGFEALASIFNLIFTDGGSLSIYRLSKDLTMCLHALLHGDILYRGQELKLIDIKGLLAKVKSQRLNGCLRIYTDERIALIFYKNGSPLGFFHDGSDDIETSAVESQRIAGLPGAKIDVLATKTADELMMYDLLEMVNVDKLWESTISKHHKDVAKFTQEAEEQDKKEKENRLKELAEDIKEIAIAYLGKVGGALVEKEMNIQGGYGVFLETAKKEMFFSAIERGAKLLTSMTKVKEMLDVIRSEIGDRADS